MIFDSWELWRKKVHTELPPSHTHCDLGHNVLRVFRKCALVLWLIVTQFGYGFQLEPLSLGVCQQNSPRTCRIASSKMFALTFPLSDTTRTNEL